MAPEQVRGEPLDARADLYSVGATLYRVLTGVPPFDAPSPMSVLAKHITDEVVPPRTRAPERSLPPEADRIVLRAMAKAPSDRYAVGQRDARGSRARAGRAGRHRLVDVAGGHAASDHDCDRDRDAVPVSRAEMPTVPIDDSDIVDGMGDRLRRADVDDYEWGLRRRRLLMRLLVPLGRWRRSRGASRSGCASAASAPTSSSASPTTPPATRTCCRTGRPLRGTIGKLNADGHGRRRLLPPAGRQGDARARRAPRGDSGRRSGAGALRRAGAPPGQERRARKGLGRVAAADDARSGRELPRGARVLGAGSETDRGRARSLHADGPLGTAARRVGERAERLAGRGDAAGGAGERARLPGPRRRSGLVRDLGRSGLAR